MTDWGSIGAVHDDVESVIAKWNHSIETGTSYDMEYRIRRAAGDYRWFHVHGLPLPDATGRIIRWHILLIHIDDQRIAEDALREREEALRSIQRKLSAAMQIGTVAEMAASIAHEINQP